MATSGQSSGSLILCELCEVWQSRLAVSYPVGRIGHVALCSWGLFDPAFSLHLRRLKVMGRQSKMKTNHRERIKKLNERKRKKRAQMFAAHHSDARHHPLMTWPLAHTSLHHHLSLFPQPHSSHLHHHKSLPRHQKQQGWVYVVICWKARFLLLVKMRKNAYFLGPKLKVWNQEHVPNAGMTRPSKQQTIALTPPSLSRISHAVTVTHQ